MTGGSERAFAKLNLALHVRGRRDDGFHAIETIFAFCEDGDELTAEPAEALALTIAGPFGGGLDPEGNLVTRAAERLREACGATVGAKIALTKLLPVASGVGGGSADAAAALRLLDRMWGCHFDRSRLEDIGRALGADVPACVGSTPMRGTGRGDVLEPVELGLSGQPVLLVNPRVELATGEVFATWDGIDHGPLGDWRMGRNDLEEPATRLVPQVRSVIAWLSAQDGVELVRMSGSGATCFAFFDSEQQRDRAAEAVPREWWRLATRLR
ncbi:MAG: 4-(cytidine 5'-diphospho)-2-C-methyl-D-erythritol kinase [Pseudomonadota bacterium]|nr:4-(cytidine 5'-diphospho)-2-C-methyl-D-erythritol kinase [Pseudomonadota bacterium]